MAVDCSNHPGTPAAAVCGSCLKSICLVCMVSERLGFVCPACLPGVRRRHRLKTAAMAVGAVALVVAAMQVYDYYQNGGAELSRLRKEQAKQPCDRGKIIRLGDALLDQDQNREAVEAAQSFWQRCGDYPRLLWITQIAHRRLGNFQEALKDSTRLIDSQPRNRNYWAWRGHIHEEMEDWPKAISDYRQALTLEPSLVDIPFDLADIYERLGRPCEAIFPLEQVLHYNQNLRNRSQIRQRIVSLYESGKCGDYAGKGRAEIRFDAASGEIVAMATLDGRQTARFLVDTGASYVAITAELAAKLGVTSKEPEVLVDTANGPTTGKPVIIDSIALQGATASRVNALIMKRLPAELDGLLGLSFLSRFDLKVDRQQGRLELSALKP
jgi:clan AA aspartic protease (TIGR02281 family)